jgi:hypothetical protein
VRVGARVPFAPPFGAIHVAWSDAATVDAWISRSTSPALTAERLRAVVRDHRATGVAVAPSTPASAPFREALAELAANPNAGELRERTLELLASIDRLDYSADDVATTVDLAVNTITAPVFDADGDVLFAVALHPVEGDLSSARRRALIADLRHATDTMTRLIADTRKTDSPESGAA